MKQVLVAHSTVRDGSMLNRDDGRDVHVFENRKTWLHTVGIYADHTYRICLTYEPNGDYCRYREVLPSDVPVTEFDARNEVADALITTQPGMALFLPIADCIGTVLYDEEHGVLMLSHLGRHSLEQHGGVRSVEYLTQQYGTDPKKVRVWLSAAIGKDLYKIFALNNKGMKEVLYEQLAEAGIKREHIEDTDHDTGTHPDYYSHSEFLKGNKPDNGRHAIVAAIIEVSTNQKGEA